MAIALHMDHHVSKAVTVGLRLRGVDVVTAYEDGTDQMDDNSLLLRAHELKRALFTQDDDLLEVAIEFQRDGTLFSGVFYGHQLRVTIGACVQDLKIMAKSGEPGDLENQVVFFCPCENSCDGIFTSSLHKAIDIYPPDGRIAPNMQHIFALPRSRRPLPTSHREGRELCFG